MIRIKTMIRIITTFYFISSIYSCGFKGPPTPLFPPNNSEADIEVKLRNLNQEQKKQDKKIATPENDLGAP